MDKKHETVLIQGASRGIGLEAVRQLLEMRENGRVIATCRAPDTADDLRTLATQYTDRLELLTLDVTDESTIEAALEQVCRSTDRLNMILNVSGVLHGPGFSPEKKLGHVAPDALHEVFAVNAFGPLLVAKHFHRLLRHDERSVFASLSARVGSISDNRLGGWYAYRASKAAQNMFTKSIAIELQRIAPNAIVVGLHPGTVDTALSLPFQRGVPKETLFTPQHSVASLLSVIDSLEPEDTGKVFDDRGEEVPP